MTKDDIEQPAAALATAVAQLRELLAKANPVESLLIYPLIKQTVESHHALEALKSALLGS